MPKSENGGADGRKGTFIRDKERLTETIVQMNRIREVGIVNAREDLQVIDDALGWLMLLDAMIR